MLAIIKERQPELLDRGDFFCSEVSRTIGQLNFQTDVFVRQPYVKEFLESTLDWSIRKGTRAAAHIPENADDVCEAAFFRIVHLANWYDIPLSVSPFMIASLR